MSHSIYGINQEINSNSSYTTGAGDGTTYGTTTTYPQSTTGNITGVFDMSGGAFEYVMGNYNENIENAGFDALPDTKYYDKYTVTSMSSCTLTECGGHALHETEGWYSDYVFFVALDIPWFRRGGGAGGSSIDGAFSANFDEGSAYSNYSWRSVVVKGK